MTKQREEKSARLIARNITSQLIRNRHVKDSSFTAVSREIELQLGADILEFERRIKSAEATLATLQKKITEIIEANMVVLDHLNTPDAS